MSDFISFEVFIWHFLHLCKNYFSMVFIKFYCPSIINFAALLLTFSLSMRHYLLHKTERDGGCCMYMEPIKYIFHGKLQNGIAGNCHKLLLLLNLHSLFSCKNYKNEKNATTKSKWWRNSIFDAHQKKEVLHIVHLLYLKLSFTSLASVVNDIFLGIAIQQILLFWFLLKQNW